jgi:predicted lipoprotein with Yx(FWY)xxD motif
MIGTKSTKLGTVLVNSQGKTLYWFAIDTSTASKCTGTCAHYWPPVLGKPTAMSGTSLPKALGSITRSGGQVQATYDGHPLYTYIGDSGPGATGGNGLTLSGGLWWAMTPTGAIVHGSGSASPSPSKSSSGGAGGGYGY